MVHLCGTIRGYASVFAAVPRRQFLEDEEAKKLSSSLFDLFGKNTIITGMIIWNV